LEFLTQHHEPRLSTLIYEKVGSLDRQHVHLRPSCQKLVSLRGVKNRSFGCHLLHEAYNRRHSICIYEFGQSRSVRHMRLKVGSIAAECRVHSTSIVPCCSHPLVYNSMLPCLRTPSFLRPSTISISFLFRLPIALVYLPLTTPNRYTS